MAKKGKLTVEQQTMVVQRLACFDTPSAIAKSLRDDYDISITPQSIENYDPNKAAGTDAKQRWRDLFEATRKAFLADTAQIGISHQSVRLRALNRMAARAEERGNLALAAQLHEQAAKEMGSAFTNRRELTGKGGEALAGPTIIFEDRPAK